MDVQAPPVVAVVVTCDPGPWFDEALRALAAQDYPNLRVVVLDAASAVDPSDRVLAALPDASVLHLDRNAGFAASVNAGAPELPAETTHLLLCHDDVAPAPDAVRQLVEEAFRSNAGVVGPKLVEWDRPHHLLQVGMDCDRWGLPVPRVERGELDQEQHDAVRDVFVAPGGCFLVRADLFDTLGGLDTAMAAMGEDVDLCWRAQVLGARVVVAPGARVRHLEAMASGLRPAPGEPPGTHPEDAASIRSAMARRHELRTILKSRSAPRLVLALPQLAALAALEVGLALVSRRPMPFGALARAWWWNLSRLGELRAARRRLQAQRRVPERDLRRLQGGGRVHLTTVRRSWADLERRHLAVAAEPAEWTAGRTLAVVAWVVVLVLMALGSRQLIGGSLPDVGQLSRWPGWSTFLQVFASGWRTSGLGSASAAPTAFALLGLGGAVAGGSTSLLHHAAVLGTLPLGALGAWYLARPLGSRWGRIATMVVYAALPLPYGALSVGRWETMVAYAGAPWILAMLLAASRMEPFDRVRRDCPAITGLARRALGLAVLVAVVGAFVPSEVLVVVLSGLGLLLGSLLTGGARASLRTLAAAVAGSAGAVLLSVPWVLGLAQAGPGLSGLGGPGTVDRAGVAQLLSLHVGRVGDAPVAWGFVVAAALPLLIGKGWRLAWASRLWTVAMCCWALAWVEGKGWLGGAPVPTGVLLAGAAAALALCVGLGVVAFQSDLRAYRFGWRQAASLVAAAGALAGTFSVVGGAVGGRWYLPSQGFGQALSFMPGKAAQGGFRVLWLGDPRALPATSWRMAPGLAWTTSTDGPPGGTSLWGPGAPGSSDLVTRDLSLARHGLTTGLGHLLAPLSIRYVVVPTKLAPAQQAPAMPPPPRLVRALGVQGDLRQLPSPPSVMVFQNTAWMPERVSLPPATATASRTGGPAAVVTAPLQGAVGVLGRPQGAASWSGRVPRGTVALLSTASPRWVLTQAGGTAAPRRPAFGYAAAYEVTRAGPATLAYHTPWSHLAGIALEGLLWLVAVAALFAWRPELRRPRRAEPRAGEASRAVELEALPGEALVSAITAAAGSSPYRPPPPAPGQ